MKKIGSNIIWTWLASLTAGFVIALPLTQFIYSNQNNPYSVIESKFKVMNQILYYVNQLYYDDVDMELLMDGAFKGIMDQLDPHSIFISAKDQKEIDEMFKGEFQGIGIEFDILNEYITVIAPVEGDHLRAQEFRQAIGLLKLMAIVLVVLAGKMFIKN